MPVAITLHILAAVIWVGGMFFAHQVLRPVAAAMLEPPVRLPLWSQIFARFFPWVWVIVFLLPATGYWMIFWVFNGFANVKPYVHVMQVTGIAMILVFLHIFFAPYRRLKQAIAIKDFPAAGKQLAVIRKLVGINLVIGLFTIAIATGGAYWG